MFKIVYDRIRLPSMMGLTLMNLRRTASTPILSLCSISLLGPIPFTVCMPIIAQRSWHFDCSSAKPAASEIHLSAASICRTCNHRKIYKAIHLEGLRSC